MKKAVSSRASSSSSASSSSIAEASPHKSVAEELEHLRKGFRALVQRYLERTEGEIAALRQKVLADDKPTDAGRVRDLRDMLILLRALQLKPDAARRKDFKKVETLLEDLRLLTENWA